MFLSRCEFLLSLLTLGSAGRAQPNLAGAPEIRLALARLNVLGSVLMIGAHPDDEHTDTLAWFARGRCLRTAYLSLTRGEGGQNLIGPEQGDLLGVIRTQELLAARRIDGAEQFFTRAIDFGFTKSAEETLAKWGHDSILSDVVWTIRLFRPDVIVLCFSGTPRDGHGQHQASGMLGKEAFAAAADRNRFPEQLRWVQPWQAKRLLWNVYGRAPESAGQISIDTGEFNPVLGHSYAEIAGLSRSMHRTQAMGMGGRRGSASTTLVLRAGEPASNDVFDGIDTTWGRVPGGAETGRILAEAARSFDALQPEKTIPALLAARAQMRTLDGHWASRKLAETDETIALCAGLWLDATADRPSAAPGSEISITLTALNRLREPLRLTGVSVVKPGGGPGIRSAEVPGSNSELAYNQPETTRLKWILDASEPYSQPYWLRDSRKSETYSVADQQLIGLAENPPVLRARFRLRAGTEELELVRPVHYRYTDRSRGELVRPLAVVPPVALEFSQPVLVAPNQQPKKAEVTLRSNVADAEGAVRLEAPAGWRVEPQMRNFRLTEPGEQTTLVFEIAPPAAPARAHITAVAVIGARPVSAGMVTLAYPHIPTQVVFPPSRADLVRADIRVLAKRVGYVMGAGDEVPQALEQMGCEVTLLSAEDLARGDLGRFDVVVAGVRAYNVRPDLRANHQRLLDYVQNGGTLLVQYNTLDYGSGSQPAEHLGPYPFRLGRERVSVEDAPVTFPDPHSPLLEAPNAITAADFEGWVQERGLYFASDWDPRYHTLLESHDPGEPLRPGGTLYTRYGKGAYVFTAWSWFRQLPAGVPGAFRMFANLLSAGKVLQ